MSVEKEVAIVWFLMKFNDITALTVTSDPIYVEFLDNRRLSPHSLAYHDTTMKAFAT